MSFFWLGCVHNLGCDRITQYYRSVARERNGRGQRKMRVRAGTRAAMILMRIRETVGLRSYMGKHELT